MRDPKRINEVLDKVRRIWEDMPDQRLFQLLLNIAPRSKELVEGQSPYFPDPYFMEDDELLERLKAIYGD